MNPVAIILVALARLLGRLAERWTTCDCEDCGGES